jgi:glycolate oxidase iron-sulfur subunit
VPYGELLMSYRAMTEPERKRPLMETIRRKLIAQTLPYPTRFRLAAKTGRLAKAIERFFRLCSLRVSMPAQLGQMLALLPDQLPKGQPLPTIYPAKGKRRARVALLSGCVQSVLAPDINWATLHVLAENGVETVIPKQQGCCGSILMHIGEEQQALKLARHNLGAFPADVEAIITNAAGCGSGMHEYGLLFKGQPEEAEAQAFAKRVQDVSLFLDQLGLRPPAGFSKPLKVAYHDACHLLHAQGIGAAPRRLLSAIPNLTLLELHDGGLCCGSAGTYNVEQPEIAAQLGERKVQHILQTGAELVVSGNIGCLTQIQSHLKTQHNPLPALHTIQLLKNAYQGE